MPSNGGMQSSKLVTNTGICPTWGPLLGRVQLTRADELMAARRAVVEQYNEGFRQCAWIKLPPKAEWANTQPTGHSWHLYSIQLGPSCQVDRDTMIGRLQDAGIGTSVHYIPLHTMPYYERQYHHQPGDFPRAMAAFEVSLSLPLYAGLRRIKLNESFKRYSQSEIPATIRGDG